jgi:hypothetical protein
VGNVVDKQSAPQGMSASLDSQSALNMRPDCAAAKAMAAGSEEPVAEPPKATYTQPCNTQAVVTSTLRVRRVQKAGAPAAAQNPTHRGGGVSIRVRNCAVLGGFFLDFSGNLSVPALPLGEGRGENGE